MRVPPSMCNGMCSGEVGGALVTTLLPCVQDWVDRARSAPGCVRLGGQS